MDKNQEQKCKYMNGSSLSVYDIDLRKYLKSATLDTFNTGQLGIRHWLAHADFEYSSTFRGELCLNSRQIFMSYKYG